MNTVPQSDPAQPAGVETLRAGLDARAVWDACREVMRGFADWRRWAWLSLYDLRLQNRRSFFGMWWPTLSLGLFTFGVGFLFAALMNRPLGDFLPHVSLGWLSWSVISVAVVGGTSVFTNARALLEEAIMPPNTLALRSLTNLAVQFCQGLVVVALAFLVVMKPVGPTAVFAIPGIVLNFIALHGVMLLLGTLSARFRDLQHFVEALMRLMFFLTPILWVAEDAGARRGLFVEYNPFAHMIEVVRQPILDGVVPWHSFAVVAILAVLANLAGILVFARARKRLIYWL